MGWLIGAAILLLILCMPVGVSAVYNALGAVVRVRVGPVSVTLFPKEKSKEKPVKKEEKIQAEQVKPATGASQANTGAGYKDFLPLLQLVFDFLKDFKTKLRINLLEMKLVIAGSDPCDVALNYGRAWAAAGNLIPQLERFFLIKKRNIDISCDFTTSQTQICAKAELTLTVGRILSLFGYHGVRILCNYLKIVNNSKGGAKA